MGRTLALNSRVNVKQATGADLPITPSQIVTSSYGPVASTAGQTTITLPFAVTVANADNFFLIINGLMLNLGSTNDFTFTNIQANGTSSSVLLNTAIPGAGVPIRAVYLGIMQPAQAATSIATVQAQVNALTALSAKNELINGAFDFWQRGTGGAANVANNANLYVADRWFVSNSSGSSANYQQVAGTVNGSKFGASFSFGAGATSSSMQLWQVLENVNFLPLYNKTISFGVWIKALGNVTQVRLQIEYNTSEAKGGVGALGAQTFAINSSGFTFCAFNNVSVGTLMGVNGTIAALVLPNAVSSGSIQDSGNGLVVEQAILNLGTTVATFARAGRNYSDELAMCQRYYEKSYDNGTALASVTTASAEVFRTDDTAAQYVVNFKVAKRIAPTSVLYDPATGATGVWHDNSAGVTRSASVNTNGTNKFTVAMVSTVAGNGVAGHWASDSEI